MNIRSAIKLSRVRDFIRWTVFILIFLIYSTKSSSLPSGVKDTVEKPEETLLQFFADTFNPKSDNVSFECRRDSALYHDALKNYEPWALQNSSGSGSFASRSLDGNSNGLCAGGNCAERGSRVSGAMWFGPRLGRRRRSDEKAESFNDDQINTIADVLQGAPWTLVPIHGDKRHANQFTPRLGRESGEELLQTLLMGDNARLGRLIDNDDIMDERQSPPPPPPPFAPRLGRHLPFAPSPRLGRRLRALLEKL